MSFPFHSAIISLFFPHHHQFETYSLQDIPSALVKMLSDARLESYAGCSSYPHCKCAKVAGLPWQSVAMHWNAAGEHLSIEVIKVCSHLLTLVPHSRTFLP
jgi:hypothetical protein